MTEKKEIKIGKGHGKTRGETRVMQPGAKACEKSPEAR